MRVWEMQWKASEIAKLNRCPESSFGCNIIALDYRIILCSVAVPGVCSCRH